MNHFSDEIVSSWERIAQGKHCAVILHEAGDGGNTILPLSQLTQGDVFVLGRYSSVTQNDLKRALRAHF